MLKIIRNEHELAQDVLKGIKSTGGYCPCALEQNEDTKCICKEFKEQRIPGDCHCGLFRKEFICEEVKK